jgi:hypothetical protein
MKLRLLPLCIAPLIAICSRTVLADKADEEFDRRLKDGYEAAAVLENSTSPDGRIAVLFTARKKNLKPANWPVIIPDVAVSATEVQASEEDYTTENWIVSLGEKKRLGMVRSKAPDFMAFHGGLNNRYFSALWGPEQEGWRYGLLNYTGRWGCTEILLANCDGEAANLMSIRGVLDTAARKFLTARHKKTAGLAIGYELLDVVKPAESVVVSDPLTMRVIFTAQVPKSDDAAEGTMRVKLARDPKGVASATVLSVKAGREEAEAVPPAPAPVVAVPSIEEFAALRKASNEKARAGGWKAVVKDQPNDEKGRDHFVKGWLEGNVVQQLMHVDSRGDDNEEIARYYWRDGVLVSIFKLAKGSYTGKSEVREQADTYDFHEGKLVHWLRSPGGEQDPKQAGFQDLGAVLQKEAIFWAEPVSKAIGAD